MSQATLTKYQLTNASLYNSLVRKFICLSEQIQNFDFSSKSKDLNLNNFNMPNETTKTISFIKHDFLARNEKLSELINNLESCVNQLKDIGVTVECKIDADKFFQDLVT